MPENELNVRLQKLHDELAAADKLDEETRENLRTLLVDIEKLLDQGCDGFQEGESSLIRSLDEHIRQLETEHPSLSSAVQQIVDGLSSLGI